MSKTHHRILAVILIACVSGVAFHPSSADSPDPGLTPSPAADDFTFVRVIYDSTGGYGQSWYRHEGRSWQRWETDFPQAEENLIQRLHELTAIRCNPKPIALRLTDEEIFDHPFIFMSDIGWQQLSNRETDCLKKYLARGGFLWVDDFWGEGEWNNFMRNMGSLRPDWKWEPIPDDHRLLKIIYNLPKCPQIPARIFYAQSGMLTDPPHVHRNPSGGWAGVETVHFMGLFDKERNLMGVATHNTDIADGWERERESEEYFERFSIDSYALTINILFYALSH